MKKKIRIQYNRINNLRKDNRMENLRRCKLEINDLYEHLKEMFLCSSSCGLLLKLITGDSEFLIALLIVFLLVSTPFLYWIIETKFEMKKLFSKKQIVRI